MEKSNPPHRPLPHPDRPLAEREVAAVQRHLLPDRLPDLPGYAFAVHYQPCNAAGGDFYGFQPFDDNRLGFVMADVSGHGVGAAVIMAVLRSALAAFRVFGRSRECAPNDINRVLNEIHVPGIFVTAFFASLDLPTGNVYCGNCGHPTPRIVRANGTVEPLGTPADSSLPLGIADEIAPPMLTAHLAPGDSLVLYTDGITEARSPHAELFSESRLDTALTAPPHRNHPPSPEHLISNILTALRIHESAHPPSDDKAILVCTRLRPG